MCRRIFDNYGSLRQILTSILYLTRDAVFLPAVVADSFSPFTSFEWCHSADADPSQFERHFDKVATCQPQLSIIIVSYNTCDALHRCLTSIQQHGNGLTIQTIVVDNGSRDNTAKMVREQMPDAVLIEPG